MFRLLYMILDLVIIRFKGEKAQLILWASHEQCSAFESTCVTWFISVQFLARSQKQITN